MSTSESSLLTTAASDSSSSADSRYCSSHTRRSHHFSAARGEATSKPAAELSSPTAQAPSRRTRRSYNLKARGVVIAKAAPSGGGGGGNQKVMCVCKVCKGERLVSKSTCYRHLRVEAELAEGDVKWEAPWNPYPNVVAHREALRMYQFLQLAGMRLGFVQ